MDTLCDGLCTFVIISHFNIHGMKKKAVEKNKKKTPVFFNPSAWGHLNPSSYCDVGRLFLGGI